MPVGSIKLKILPVIKLPQVKSRYLVPLCVIFSMYWRLNIIIWFDLRVITFLTGTTAVKTVAHSPKPQNNLTILFFDSKKKYKIGIFRLFLRSRKSAVDFSLSEARQLCVWTEGHCRVVSVVELSLSLR